MKKTIPIFMAFLCMGFVDSVGPLVGLVKESFVLSNFLAQLIALSGFIMFGVLSIPMGIVQDKKGRKYTLLLGLVIACIGMLIPIFNGMYGPEVNLEGSSMSKFYTVLLAILMLGAGAAILQVAGNPIMRDVSDEGHYSSNLSFAQSIKAIGSSMGFLIPPAVAIAFGMDWSILFPMFFIFILMTLVWIKLTPIQEKKDENASPATFTSCLKLLGNPYVFSMVLAIFVYVGAEVSMSSGIPILMKESYGITNLGLWLTWALFFLPILIGRFTGSAILRKMKATTFLIYTTIIAVGGTLLLLLGSQVLAFIGIVLVGLGYANIFPLVFSITVDKMPERSNELSGLMVSAIVGGAVLPPVMGLVADKTSVLLGFIVPLSALIYIGIVSFNALKKA